MGPAGKAAAAIFGGALLSACQTMPPAKGAPAVLTNSSEKLTVQITEIVSKALHGTKVTIAPDVLTKSPSLIIELAGRGGIGGDPVMGRRMDRPDHFTLSLNGKKCVLTHEQSGESYYLRGAKCEAIATP